MLNLLKPGAAVIPDKILRKFADADLALGVRIAVVVAALGVLFLRTPITFIHPQFWGEDAYLFHASRFQGWSSLSIAWAGYLSVAQFLVALFCSYFSPVYAALLYCYASIAVALMVVWLLTSPRLAMPYKPLLALAVVVVPMGREELGTVTNIQWILPIGVFAFLFMEASRSRLVLAAETFMAAVMAVSGPFSIFLTPMFIWQLLRARDAEERRMFCLTAAVGLGALIQVLVIANNPGAVSAAIPAPYSRTLWVNLPASHIMTVFGPAAQLFQGVGGALLGLLCVAVAAVLALCRPYRTQKIFMLLFAVAIAVSGMYKFRAALATQIPEQRYFYPGSIFLLWFICCISSQVYLRTFLAAAVAVTELLLLPAIANTPRAVDDLEWPVWSSYISSGLPVIIPISPPGFYVSLPADPTGPFSNFESWTGKSFAKVAHLQISSSCAGEMDPVEPLTVYNISALSGLQLSDVRWSTSGWAWDQAADSPVKLVVLVNSTGNVTGFGLPGFKSGAQMAPARSRWNAIFYDAPGSTVRAYAILQDGRHICPLANQWYFPLVVRPIASDRFAHALAILPGSQIVQRFKPLPGLVGMSETFVSFAHIPSQYTIHWRIDARSDGHVLELGSGDINASTVSDWQHINLPMVTPGVTPDEITVSFQTDPETVVLRPAGVPLFVSGAGDKDPPVEIDGAPDPSGLQLGLTVDYGK